MHLMAVKKSKKCSEFVIDSYLKDSAFISVKRDALFSTRYVKGYHFSIGGIRKEYLFCEKCYIKG